MVEQGGLATLPVSTTKLRQARQLGARQCRLPTLDNGNGGDAEVEEALAKLLVG